MSQSEILSAIASGTMTVEEGSAMMSKGPAGCVGIDKLTGIGDLVPKTFKTGSRGYWAGGKVTINGERCQVTVTVTVIGSKPVASAA